VSLNAAENGRVLNLSKLSVSMDINNNIYITNSSVHFLFKVTLDT